MTRSRRTAGSTLHTVEREFATLLRRARADYREMPGLILNRAQMQRLWGVDGTLCDAVIESLVQARVVRRIRHDYYVAFESQA